MSVAVPASAVVVIGRYAGVVTAGFAEDAFGFVARTDLTGQAVTGTFTYDTARFSDRCDGGGAEWFICFRAAGALTISQTIGGATEIFSSDPLPAGAPSYNRSEAGISHSTLISEAVELATRRLSGSIQDGFDHREIHLAALLPTGQSWPGRIADGIPRFSGPTGGGAAGDTGIANLIAGANQTIIFGLKTPDPIRETRFSFDITSFAIAPEPEPATSAMIVCGFGLIGVSIRRSRGTVAV